MKIAVVTPIPTPYRDPFWNVVASQPTVQLDVFYCAPGKPDRPWQVDWEASFQRNVLRGWNLNSWRSDSSLYWNPEIYETLAADYDAVLIGGYNHPTMLVAMRICRRRGMPYYLMCETYRRRNTRTVPGFAKDLVVRRVIRNAAGGLPTGKLASQYLADHGLPQHKQFCLPNVPDIERIRDQVTHVRPMRTASAYLQTSAKQVLFVGRLIPKKRVADLIAAFGQVVRETEATLVIVGDGPLRPQLETDVVARGLQDRVRFTGFVQPSDTMEHYARSDLFVLPSNETWGVAAIEALAAGLPVVLSDKVGCHADVLSDPAAGTSFPCGDVEALAGAINRTLQIARNDSVSLVKADWSYDTLSQQFVGWIAKSISICQQKTTIR